MDRDFFVNAVISACGKLYRYGSNGPNDFDCSGLIVGCMRKRWSDYEDTNSRGLFERYKKYEVSPEEIGVGCLLFYSNYGHVVVCTHDHGEGYFSLIGANGGTSHTNTIQSAYSNRALVGPSLFRIVDGRYEGFWATGFNGAVDPFKGDSNG